ncbi:hypothetical protein HAX54_042090 [Datura stramonium]|uniref:Uncharacterized protein n=1 Tax=Datura stramonium TaxID=4076 RepID=A0ABS8VZ30_DATST|nr:hypothetical protein [Datura stramonium]
MPPRYRVCLVYALMQDVGDKCWSCDHEKGYTHQGHRIGPAFVEPVDDDVPTDEERRREDSNIESDNDEADEYDLGERPLHHIEEIEIIV